jgi:hypothetical protein
MKAKEEIIESIAHISHILEDQTIAYFQVLNESQDDWNEEATNLEYQTWIIEYFLNKRI